MPPYKRKMVPAVGFTPTKVRKYSNTVAVQRMRYSRTAFRSGQENNYVDVAYNAYANNTTGSITLLNTVAQGSSVNQRIGKKWLMKSIQWHGSIHSSTTTTHAEATTLLVYDSKPTGSLPAITDILVTANAFAFNNDNNTDRFRIVRRWNYNCLGNITTPTTGKESFNFDGYQKLNLPVVNKAAGTGAIADIETGALYLVTVGDTPSGTAQAITDATFRIRFSDM